MLTHPSRMSVCQSISANLATAQGPNSHRASSLAGGCYRIASQFFRAVQ